MVITLVTRLQHRRFGEKKGEHWKKWQKSFLTFCSFPTRPPPVFIHFFFAHRTRHATRARRVAFSPCIVSDGGGRVCWVTVT